METSLEILNVELEQVKWGRSWKTTNKIKVKCAAYWDCSKKYQMAYEHKAFDHNCSILPLPGGYDQGNRMERRRPSGSQRPLRLLNVLPPGAFCHVPTLRFNQYCIFLSKNSQIFPTFHCTVPVIMGTMFVRHMKIEETRCAMINRFSHDFVSGVICTCTAAQSR